MVNRGHTNMLEMYMACLRFYYVSSVKSESEIEVSFVT